MAERLDLEDIITDDVLKESFLVFLKGNYMSANLELWLDIAEYEGSADDGRESVYNVIYKRYFEKGCESPVCLPNRIAQNITQYYQASYLSFAYGNQQKRSFPADLFLKAKEELWTILQLTCLPMFLMSHEFISFQNGVTDSAKTLFSRTKCEWFFGQTIQGPLKRQEILVVYGSSGNNSNSRQNQKRIKEEVKRDSKISLVWNSKKKKTTTRPFDKEKDKENIKENGKENEKDKGKEKEVDKEKMGKRDSGTGLSRSALSNSGNKSDKSEGEGGGAVGLWELFK